MCTRFTMMCANRHACMCENRCEARLWTRPRLSPEEIPLRRILDRYMGYHVIRSRSRRIVMTCDSHALSTIKLNACMLLAWSSFCDDRIAWVIWCLWLVLRLVCRAIHSRICNICVTNVNTHLNNYAYIVLNLNRTIALSVWMLCSNIISRSRPVVILLTEPWHLPHTYANISAT